MPSNVKLLAGASGGEPTDANFKNVTLLLHGDGSNGAQNNTFIDSSSNNFTITRNGNTTQGSFSPYGSNWSNYFDGSGDYLSLPDNAALELGSSDITIEMWINTTNSTQYSTLYSRTINFFASGDWTLLMNNSSSTGGEVGLYVANYSTSSPLLVTSGVSVRDGVWHHIAVVRNGSSWTIYVDGVSRATATWSGTVADVSGGPWIGKDQSFNRDYVGYISNLRVVKGTAVYTSAFTPSTTPLTAITNTSLLTCAYNRFRDGSTNNFTITRNGDVKVTNFAPFAPSSSYSTTTNGGSAYFDGTGDYLTAPDNTAFDFGSGNFTIEMWVYRNNATNPYALFAKRNNSDSETKWISSYINTNGTIQVQLSTNGSSWAFNSATTSAAATTGWTHLAFVRNGSDFSVYVDGAKNTISSSLSGSVFTDTNPVAIGQLGLSGSFLYTMNGYISNFRIVKGTAVYTAAFTPTTTPLTAISGTSLLTNFTNAAIFDNSMKNDLETVGNAQISTSVKKFGTGSMYFDGTGDNLICNTSTPDHFAFGSGDFTIELWAYMNSVSGIQVFYDGRPASVQTFAPTIYINGTQVRYFNNGADRITGGTVATGTWYHIALCRSGTSTKLFLDGTQIGSTYTDSSVYTNTAGRPGIGFDANASLYYLNGYIDELRVTKGVARYTSNFTAPTAPFPNK